MNYLFNLKIFFQHEIFLVFFASPVYFPFLRGPSLSYFYELHFNSHHFIFLRSRLQNSKYSVKDFLDEVHSKLTLKSRHKFVNEANKTLDSSLNISMDEDYEFDRSDDESSDEEMRENMLRLVEKENDECLGDSGYSEEGTLKTATMLDHSYSKSIQSLVRPHSRRESKGVDALLHLANAATRELENLSNNRRIHLKMDRSNNSTDLDFRNLHCAESSDVFTAEKSCQFNSSATVTMS